MRTYRFAGFIALLTIIGGTATASQPMADVDRLMAAGKLWVTVNYFHPSLASKPIDWDQALIGAIPRIRAAATPETFAAAIHEMLSPLDNPAARVLMPTDAGVAAGLGFAAIELRGDGVLLARTGVTPADPVQTGEEFYRLLPRAAAVVLDTRAGLPHPWLLGPGAFSTKPVVMPGLRFRLHNGLRPDRGGWASPYYSAIVTRDAAPVPPSPSARDVPVVFLVPDERYVPALAAALQDAGNGYVVAVRSVGGTSFRPPGTNYRQLLTDGIRVDLPVAEVAHADGTTGLCVDRIAEGDPLEAALTFAQRPFRSECRRPLGTSGPVQQRVNPPHDLTPLPPEEYRLLAAFRVWGVFEYLFPYRDLMAEDWELALRQAIPRLLDASTPIAYHLAMSELVAKTQDSHATISSAVLADHFGDATPGIALRTVDGTPVVTTVLPDVKGVNPGDVVIAVDGQPASARLTELSRYIAASTPQALLRDATDRLLRGRDGSQVAVMLRDAGNHEKTVSLTRARGAERLLARGALPERIRLLNNNVGYIDLRQITQGEIDGAFERLKDTVGIIFDMRGYPLNTRFGIARWLAREPEITWARVRRRVLFSPASATIDEVTSRSTLQLDPKRHYAGPTVMLIDERAQSQSEETGLVLRAANGTRFVGSPTAGANGDSTAFQVPGGIYVSLTGQGVTYPDGRQLQRVGLIPDVAVAPTLRGIREGRDEVLERAVQVILRR